MLPTPILTSCLTELTSKVIPLFLEVMSPPISSHPTLFATKFTSPPTFITPTFTPLVIFFRLIFAPALLASFVVISPMLRFLTVAPPRVLVVRSFTFTLTPFSELIEPKFLRSIREPTAKGAPPFTFISETNLSVSLLPRSKLPEVFKFSLAIFVEFVSVFRVNLLGFALTMFTVFSKVELSRLIPESTVVFTFRFKVLALGSSSILPELVEPAVVMTEASKFTVTFLDSDNLILPAIAVGEVALSIL